MVWNKHESRETYVSLLNRIISAWSDRLAVIAPGKNSGALITANIAQKIGREVVIYG